MHGRPVGGSAAEDREGVLLFFFDEELRHVIPRLEIILVVGGNRAEIVGEIFQLRVLFLGRMSCRADHIQFFGFRRVDRRDSVVVREKEDARVPFGRVGVDCRDLSGRTVGCGKVKFEAEFPADRAEITLPRCRLSGGIVFPDHADPHGLCLLSAGGKTEQCSGQSDRKEQNGKDSFHNQY